MTTNTKKVRYRKLRGGPVIAISEQIFNWRAKKKLLSEKAAKAAQLSTVNTLYNAPECPINDKQPDANLTLPWDMFK